MEMFDKHCSVYSAQGLYGERHVIMFLNGFCRITFLQAQKLSTARGDLVSRKSWAGKPCERRDEFAYATL